MRGLRPRALTLTPRRLLVQDRRPDRDSAGVRGDVPGVAGPEGLCGGDLLGVALGVGGDLHGLRGLAEQIPAAQTLWARYSGDVAAYTD